MSSPYDEQVENLLARYREAREQAADTRRHINETEATVTAPRKVVKVTVGAQGQVTALDFPTAAYRTMTPKDLSRTVLTALEQARSQALSKVAEVALSGMLGGVPTADLLRGDVDARSFLPEDLELPEAVRAYVDHGLGVPEEGDRRG
ncbi:YbaB/EbfC family nucleoid-associated protein [Streptomyces sp. PTM05]|uniref:YbaB/EbfC family nucleoid-associated protein n=1 Tax=Streptantibioticus parmotrematis TaxID=2873249 RepID=A0ABS7QS99_9ACTN|nr:YbaB/EbfC family nucleoid-associated protein [Streptantibioticus parmotrematis]MBY8886060.1 YbaB/EbfC family nucleoid-associated protein [Streptantibioticus parmotrematis]